MTLEEIRRQKLVDGINQDINPSENFDNTKTEQLIPLLSFHLAR